VNDGNVLVFPVRSVVTTDRQHIPMKRIACRYFG